MNLIISIDHGSITISCDAGVEDQKKLGSWFNILSKLLKSGQFKQVNPLCLQLQK
jgi:hypothetical protein